MNDFSDVLFHVGELHLKFGTSAIRRQRFE
jgi:hypothetical protein